MVLVLVLTGLLLAYYIVGVYRYDATEPFTWIEEGRSGSWDEKPPYQIKLSSSVDSILIYLYRKTILNRKIHIYTVYEFEKQDLVIIASPTVLSLAVALIKRKTHAPGSSSWWRSS